MNMKRILLVFLIAVAIIASLSAVSAGLFDGLMDEGSLSDVIEIENVTFNTTNATKFEYAGVDEEGWTMYKSAGGKCIFSIINDTNLNDSQYDFEVNELKDFLATNYTVQNVNGVDLYTLSEDGDDAEFYYAYVIDDDLKSVVQFISTDPNEAAYMASTLEFK